MYVKQHNRHTVNFDLRIFGFTHPMNRCPTAMQRTEVVPTVIAGGGIKYGFNVSYYTVFDYYETLVVAQGRTVSPEPQIILTRLQTNNVTQLYALRFWYKHYVITY